MASELFIWYRCSADAATRVQAAAQRLLATVRSEHGLHGRLLQRLDAEATWMEHYVLDEASAHLAQPLAEGCGLWDGALPARHAEAFACIGHRDRP